MKETINKYWLKINLFFATTFSKAFKFLKENSAIAVKVTQILKTSVESPLADIAVTLIPGEVDNEVLYRLRKIIPEVANKVAIAAGIYEAAKANNEAVTAIVNYLKGLNPEGRTKFWVDFAAELNLALADGKITYTEAVILSQMAYKELFEK